MAHSLQLLRLPSRLQDPPHLQQPLSVSASILESRVNQPGRVFLAKQFCSWSRSLCGLHCSLWLSQGRHRRRRQRRIPDPPGHTHSSLPGTNSRPHLQPQGSGRSWRPSVGRLRAARPRRGGRLPLVAAGGDDQTQAHLGQEAAQPHCTAWRQLKGLGRGGRVCKESPRRTRGRAAATPPCFQSRLLLLPARRPPQPTPA